MTTRHLARVHLVLADDDSTALTAAPPGACIEAADGERRTIRGTIAPYGVPGSTSAGALSIRAGGIRLPADLRRVKSNLDHDRNRSTGYLSAAEDGPDALRGTIRLARTPLGDEALLDAQEGVRDALSVELTDVTVEGTEITDGLLVAIGQVPIPAYTDARVEHVAASQQEGNTMECQHCGRVHADGTLEARACAAVVQASQTPQTQPQAPAQPVAQPVQTPQPAPVQTQPQPVAQPAVQAAAPAGLPMSSPARPGDRSLDGLYAAMAAAYRGESGPDITAALADITQSAHDVVNPDSYEGQLWSGVQYQRRIVPLMASGVLRSYKGTGWRWVVKPEVDDYAGDKAEVPSNIPDTEAEPWTAQRLAGAHDIDRKFYDFGDREFIAAYFEAMRESYAVKSDDRALDFLLTSATDVGDAPDVLRAAALAADAVEDATGQTASYFLVNRADRRSLLDITDGDVPTFLAMFGVRPEAFISHPGVGAGKVVAGVKAAAEFKELPGSPIRVEALRISHGGVDGGVFGYYATLLHNAGGVASVDIVTAP